MKLIHTDGTELAEVSFDPFVYESLVDGDAPFDPNELFDGLGDLTSIEADFSNAGEGQTPDEREIPAQPSRIRSVALTRIDESDAEISLLTDDEVAEYQDILADRE